MRSAIARVSGIVLMVGSYCVAQVPAAVLTLKSANVGARGSTKAGELRLDGWFYEISTGRQELPATLFSVDEAKLPMDTLFGSRRNARVRTSRSA